jgi:hypothetical protein
VAFEIHAICFCNQKVALMKPSAILLLLINPFLEAGLRRRDYREFLVRSAVRSVGMTQKRSIQLSAELCVAAEQRYQHVYGNIEELLDAVLAELVRDDAARLDEAEQELVQRRLRELGYL